MDEFDLLKKEEIVIQDLIYKNSVLQVDVPLHPKIFSLANETRLDESIPRKIITNEDFIKENEADIGSYLHHNSDILNEEIINELGINKYIKFNPNWKFIFSKSNFSDFLDLTWNDGNLKHQLGYLRVPSVIFNYRKSPESLWSAKEIIRSSKSHINSIFFGRESLADSSLILFEKLDKFSRFHGDEFHLDTLAPKVETTTHTFSSTCLNNISQAIILRNFAVCYLNELTTLAFSIDN